MLAAWVIGKVITTGHLTIVGADGRAHDLKASDSPRVTIRLHDKSLHWKIGLYPSLHIGEAFTDGTLTFEQGTLRELLEMLLIGQAALEATRLSRFQDKAKHLFYRRKTINRFTRARTNVKHHYDLSGELYDLFLDPDRQYSCAYFNTPADSLDLAQLQKKQHLAAKMVLRPGQKVLDIGCGWGGMAIYLAKTFDVDVTGLTLSDEQLAVARQRAEDEGLSDRIEFKLLDYRLEPDIYDRIVSVGMFEHVGEPHHAEFFGHLKRLLKDDGIAVLHTIGKQTTPSPINAWVRHYIFPGAYLPTMSQLTPILEDQGMWLNDFENLRLHYAETLKAWDANFQRNRARVAEIYDEKFCRMWEFYLQSCEMGFRHAGLSVFQLQITKSLDIAPLTRDHMFETERRLRGQDGADPAVKKVPAG